MIGGSKSEGDTGMNSDSVNRDSVLSKLRLPQGAKLVKKELFEYVTPDNVYDIELYTQADSHCYAIGVPREGEKLIVYGSNIVPAPELAIQNVIDKIARDQMWMQSGHMADDEDDAADLEEVDADPVEDSHEPYDSEQHGRQNE
jgi:hypothetical protein